MKWNEILKRAQEVLAMGATNTAATYIECLKLFSDKPTPESVLQAVQRWRSEVSSNTILVRFAALKWVFKHFRREFDRDDVDDILAAMDGVKRQEKKMQFASSVQVKKILDLALMAGQYREGLAVAMMYYGGMRIGEVLNCKLSQFGDVIFIAESKNNTQREVPVHPIMRMFFDLYMAERDTLSTSDSEFLFITAQGNISRSTIQHNVKKLCKKAGYSKLHCHSFRHGCATTLARAGVSEFTIKEYMGHKNMNTTAKYVHISKEQLQSAQAVMD